MTAQETPEVLNSLFEAILAYQDTQEGLARVRQTAESLWGAVWRQKLPLALQDCPESDKAKVKANIDRALTYEKAGSVWAEASRLLDPKRPIDVSVLTPRMPEMQKWLAIFGKAGQDLFVRLEQKLAEAIDNPQSNAVSVTGNYGLSVEQLWSFDHFLRLKDYYDQTISRTSARCVHLGGLELTQYPYYGFVLDLLDEILTFGDEILNVPAYAPVIQARYKGGEPALRKVLAEFKKEFRDNAPPEMIDDDESIDEIKNRLGTLAGGVEESDIGPAPDGFEPATDIGGEPMVAGVKRPMMKTASPKGPPSGIVPMGKMPQKVPIAKAPQAGLKMPTKAPMPQGS